MPAGSVFLVNTFDRPIQTRAQILYVSSYMPLESSPTATPIRRATTPCAVVGADIGGFWRRNRRLLAPNEVERNVFYTAVKKMLILVNIFLYWYMLPGRL